MAKQQKADVVVSTGQLWPKTPWGSQMQIEVFGATGEFSTGKTLMGLSIAPGLHLAGHAFAGQPRTYYLDLEKSGTSYAGTGCERIDVPAVLVKLYGAGYTAKQAAEWFNGIPARVKPGQYDVCVVDPINDIESGQVDIVKANPTAYGYTKGQIDNSTPLLMAAMKAHYKKLLMGFAGVFKCLYFTTHLRDEFKGGKPTSRREPRGKETLAELSSLYLWLERLPDDKGNTSAIPSAIVIKHRLSDTRVNEHGELEIVELMPRRIPVATVQAIRQYIANPPNIEKPAAGEKVIEKPVTEVELQTIRLHVAEAETAAATARSNLLERQRELAAVRQSAPITAPAPAAATKTTPPADRAVATNEELQAVAARLAASEAEDKRLMQQNQQANQSTTPPNGRVERFKALVPASGVSMEKLKAAIAKHGASRFTELSPELQDGLLVALEKAAAGRQQAQPPN